MEEQLSGSEQSSDGSGTGFFMKVDLFDHVTRSLSVMYSELWSIETSKDAGDMLLADKYLLRSREILKLRDRFPLSGIRKRDKAANAYFSELAQIRGVLSQNY